MRLTILRNSLGGQAIPLEKCNRHRFAGGWYRCSGSLRALRDLHAAFSATAAHEFVQDPQLLGGCDRWFYW